MKKKIDYSLKSIGENFKLENKLKKFEMSSESLSKSLENIEKDLEGLNKLGNEFGKFIEEKIIEIEESVKREREEITEEIGGILNAYLKNFIENIPEKGLLDSHSSYSEKCNMIIEGGVIDMKDEINKKIFKYRENKIRLLNDFVYDVRIKANELAGKYISYSSSDFTKMIEEFFKEVPNLYDESFVLDVESSGWWFFGTGKERREVIYQIKEHFRKLEVKINEELVYHSQILIAKILYLGELTKQEVIQPIIHAIKRRKYNYYDKK